MVIQEEIGHLQTCMKCINDDNSGGNRALIDLCAVYER